VTRRLLSRGFAILFLLVLGARTQGQQPRAPSKDRQIPAPPAFARIWKSQTTGKEYRVWVENERLHAEWVNISPESVQGGAFIRIECRRVGNRWLGTAQNRLPCETTEKGKRITNWCRLVTRIEFDPLEASRITGHTEWARRFDCANCKILEPVWTGFVWVPKEPSAVGGKQ